MALQPRTAEQAARTKTPSGMAVKSPPASPAPGSAATQSRAPGCLPGFPEISISGVACPAVPSRDGVCQSCHHLQPCLGITWGPKTRSEGTSCVLCQAQISGIKMGRPLPRL